MWSGFPSWVLFSLPAAVLAGMASLGYAAWQTRREIRKGLGAAVKAQEELRRDLDIVADALEKVAETLRNEYQPDLRQRIQTVQAARSGNGSPRDRARRHV